MPMMNAQGARIMASGKLDEKAVAGNYMKSTRALLMAYRFYKGRCQDALDDGRVAEAGDDFINLDRLVSELRRRGRKIVCPLPGKRA